MIHAQRYSRAEEFATALSQAIFPRTPDDFAEITEVFFTQHPEFFAPVEAHKGGPGLEPDTTRSVPITGVNKVPESLELVTKFLKRETEELRRRPQKRSWPLIGGMTLGVLVIALGLSTALVLKQRPASSPPPAAVQPPTSMFPTPPPTPPPAQPAQNPGMGTPPPAVPSPKPPPAAPSGVSPPARTRNPHAALQRRDKQRAAIAPIPAFCAACISSATDRPRAGDATIGIDTSGKVNLLGFEPRLGGESASCITSVLKKVQLRRHPDPDLQVKLPIVIRKLDQ